jgi:histidinol dehydrogenase
MADYQRLTPEGTRRVAPSVAAICDAELFEGHALTARMRLERLGEDGGARDVHATAGE